MWRKKLSRSSRPLRRRGEATESSRVTRPAVHLKARRYVERPLSRLEFSAAVEVNVPPERAFDYFADHGHVAEVLRGVTRWEPIGSRSAGVGARYDVELVALGLPLRSVLRLNRWRRPREIGWVSESGVVKQEGGFLFTKVPEGVRIELRIAYEPPAAALGAAIAKRVDWVVRNQLQRALERVRDILESAPS
jgi:uncharacterized membrane protein